MNQRGRGDQGVTFGSRVGTMKSGTTLRHRHVDRQHTAFEPGEYLMVDPGTQPAGWWSEAIPINAALEE